MLRDKKEYSILIGEDNPGDFTLVEDLLFEQIAAPKVTHARSYKAASLLLGGAENIFDVILLDLTLPDKTGEPLIREVIDLALNIPIIVLTGYTDFDFGVRSLSLGIADYLLKDDLTAIALHRSIVYNIERKKIIADLEESERRYSDQFNFSPLPMWVIDLDTLYFLDVNKATIDHYGYSREELLNMTLRDIRPVEDIPEPELGIAEDREGIDSYAQRMVMHTKKDGTLINVDIQISQIMYKGRKANVVIATDVTEKLAYCKAIEEQNEKLREISWLQSHIIRAPLARMMGLMTLVKEDCDEKEKVIDYLMDSANELDEVIRNIIDISKIKSDI